MDEIMKIEEMDSSNDAVVVRMTRAELVLLKNALNEVCHGVKIPAFDTRLGYSKDVAKGLLNQLWDVIKKLDDLNPQRERTQIIANSPKGEAYLRKIKRNE